MNLKQENELLKQQLASAKRWMAEEVHNAQKLIAREQTQGETHSLYHENLEDIITERIYSFFPNEVLVRFPEDAVKNILSSELIYYHIIHGSHVDGTGVILGYQKVLDSMIELYITKNFRKYISKNPAGGTRVNSSLEKAFYNVVEKNYSISIGRLYAVLKDIQSKTHLGPYSQSFCEYLRSRPFLEKALLHTDFLLQLETLEGLGVLGEKRHHGSVSQDDTTKARDMYIGNFQDTNSLLYILAHSQSVDV